MGAMGFGGNQNQNPGKLPSSPFGGSNSNPFGGASPPAQPGTSNAFGSSSNSMGSSSGMGMNDLRKRVTEEKSRSPFSGSPGNANAGFSPFGSNSNTASSSQQSGVFGGTGINGSGASSGGINGSQSSSSGRMPSFGFGGAPSPQRPNGASSVSPQDIQLDGNPQTERMRSQQRAQRLEQARQQGMSEARREEERRLADERNRMQQLKMQQENQARMDEVARMSAEKRMQALNGAIAASDEK
jgi:hypothetical protein